MCLLLADLITSIPAIDTRSLYVFARDNLFQGVKSRLKVVNGAANNGKSRGRTSLMSPLVNHPFLAYHLPVSYERDNLPFTDSPDLN